MTAALAWPLQQALFARLNASPAVTAHLGTRIFDAGTALDPAQAASGPWAVLGDEEIADWSTATGRGAEHRITLSVLSAAAGFAGAKQAAAAICDALLEPDLPLGRGHVVCIGFLSARTARTEGDALRRIDLRFRLLIEDTA